MYNDTVSFKKKYSSSVLPGSVFSFTSIINLSTVGTGSVTAVSVAECVIYSLRIVLKQELLTISKTTKALTNIKSLHKSVHCV